MFFTINTNPLFATGASMAIIFLSLPLLNFFVLDLTSIQNPGAQRVKDEQMIPVNDRLKKV